MLRQPRLAAFALTIFFAGGATAHDYILQELRIDHPFARATPPGAQSGGIYLTIENRGTSKDRLVRVASPAAASVELHSMTMDGSVMRMRAIAGLDIAPGATVTLGSAGYHVMLVGLVRPLVVGDRIPVTLTFENAGAVDVTAFVEAMTPGGSATHGAAHPP
jgi:copper(I)-binding protein